MQDRFKFRVYYKPHKKIYNVICLNCLNQKEIIIEYKGSSAVVEWENCIILQCTGLKDINGKLIYEGGYVKLKCVSPWGEEIEALGKIYYDRCSYWIKFLYHCSLLYCEEATYEILGNIYENPELLESEKNESK